MPHWLYSDSLKNAGTYAQAQQHWMALWQTLMSEINRQHPWQTPWFDNPLLDGNPIFSALCIDKPRGVRIIQEDPGDPDDIDLDWWLDYVGEKTSPDAIPELVIACCPSRENMPEAERLLREWIEKGEVTPPGRDETMEEPARDGCVRQPQPGKAAP